MICDTPHFTGGCGSNKYALEAYLSQKDCMEKGIEMRNPSGFECGYGCKKSDGGALQICDLICNEKGSN